jgi:uncharacterized DUF497 family protein
MDVEWDPGNLSEIERHSVQTQEAESAITDPSSEASDVYERNGEPRTRVIGRSGEGRILVVIYTFRGESVRIVTAYPASRGLAARYEERHP